MFTAHFVVFETSTSTQASLFDALVGSFTPPRAWHSEGQNFCGSPIGCPRSTPVLKGRSVSPLDEPYICMGDWRMTR